MPLVLSVSARDPASIHTPTVDVCAHGECSVAICAPFSSYSGCPSSTLTVSPLDSVVDSVFTPFFITGVANPLFSGETALRAARLRSPWVRLRVNRRDAMEVVNEGDVGRFLNVQSRGMPGSKSSTADFEALSSSQSPGAEVALCNRGSSDQVSLGKASCTTLSLKNITIIPLRNEGL